MGNKRTGTRLGVRRFINLGTSSKTISHQRMQLLFENPTGKEKRLFQINFLHARFPRYQSPNAFRIMWFSCILSFSRVSREEHENREPDYSVLLCYVSYAYKPKTFENTDNNKDVIEKKSLWSHMRQKIDKCTYILVNRSCLLT